MKRKLETSFLFLAVGLLSSTCTGQRSPFINLEVHGICGENAIHGLSQMKSGYDMTSFSIGDLEESVRGELFDYTCNNKASAPYYKKTITYPDQFVTPHITVKLTVDEKTSFVDHFEEFTREEGNGIKVDEKKDFFQTIGKGLGTAVDAATSIANISFVPKVGPIFEAIGAIGDYFVPPPPKKTITKYSEYLQTTETKATMNLDMKVHELVFKDAKYLVMKDDFIEAYKALPASFLESPEPYLDFIKKYGTQYIYKATFGGRIRSHSMHNSSTLTTSRKTEIEKEYKKWFTTLKDTNVDSNTSGDKKKYGEKFLEGIGGNPGLASGRHIPANIGAWEESVYNNPVPIKVSMVPIVALVANETIRIEVAQAIVYSVNKAHVDRYRMLMNDVMTKWSVGAPWRGDMAGIEIGDFDRFYTELYDEMYYVLKRVSATYESMITKMTKEVHEKARTLTIAYQNVKGAYELWNQVITWDDLDEAAANIDKIYEYDRNKWYTKPSLDGREVYTEKAWEAIYLIGNITATLDDLSLRTRSKHIYEPLKKLSTMNDFNEKMFWLKEGVDKYSKVRTISCEDVVEKDKCYTYTVCSTQMHMYERQWRADKDWRDYNWGQIKYLSTMLTSMQHPSWESKRRELYENKFKQCNEWWGEADIENTLWKYYRDQ